MKRFFIIFTFLFPLFSQAKKIKATEVYWLPQVAEKNISEFNVCGNSDIQPTKKSLLKHFSQGAEQTGFFFSNLISSQRYYALLSEKNLEEAKSALEDDFNKTHLWKYSKDKGIEDLGTPRKVDFHFTATIKDCLEGAKTTLGTDCSRFEGTHRRSCCREKFVGPVVFWGSDKEEYKLLYSPDPSIRLKVPGERKHRYCNVQESISLQ